MIRRPRAECGAAPGPHPPCLAGALRHGVWPGRAGGRPVRRPGPGAEFLRPCGIGFGPGAFAIASPEPPGATAAALSRPGQAGRPPVHERRAVARRHVRPQAAARQVPRQAAARAQPAHRAQDRRGDALAVQVPASTARAASRSASCSPQTAAAHRRHLRHPLDARRRAQPRAVADADELRRRPAAAAQHRLVGHLRPGHRRTRTCPASSPCAPAATRSSATQNWRSAFLPGAYQGTYIDTQHTDVDKLIENIRNNASTPAEQRRQLDLVRQLNERHLRDAPARRRSSKPASSRSSWPSACRPRRPTRSTSAASRSTSATMYGAGTHGRQLLIARRLLERGVRFVQVWNGAGQPWDNHDDLESRPPQAGRRVGPGRSPRS